MTQATFRAWEEEYKQVRDRYPRWPNEVMLKLAFGGYLVNRMKIEPELKVLDVGCGSGNNLIPFLDRGCRCFGVEVTPDLVRWVKKILAQRGYRPQLTVGSNRSLPFKNNFFDLLLSVNVIHYESSQSKIMAALKEYWRVLKPNGKLIMLTVGPQHDIVSKAKRLKPHQYRVRDFDFRNGSNIFGFDTKGFLRKCLKSYFDKIEIGRVTEDLMKMKLDFWIAVAEAKR